MTSLWESPEVLRAKANDIRVEALSMTHPAAAYFVRAAELDRQADAIEAANRV